MVKKRVDWMLKNWPPSKKTFVLQLWPPANVRDLTHAGVQQENMLGTSKNCRGRAEIWKKSHKRKSPIVMSTCDGIYLQPLKEGMNSLKWKFLKFSQLLQIYIYTIKQKRKKRYHNIIKKIRYWGCGWDVTIEKNGEFHLWELHLYLFLT